MTEARRTNQKAGRRVPEFLREPLEAAQARLEAFEDEAQRVWKELVQRSKAGRKEVTELVQKLQKQDWHLPELRDRLEKLRETGLERAQEWRDRADHLRAEAMERLLELQGRAVAFLGVATREQVEELSREVEKILTRLEKGARGRKPRRRAKRQDSGGASQPQA